MLFIALVYGGIAGAISIGTIVFSMLVSSAAHPGSEWLGYLIMILAFSLIFFGIKRYRDQDKGGIIKFVPALLCGLAIAAVASIAYVLVWEIYLAATNNAFIHDFAAAYIDQKQAEGLAGDALAAEQAYVDGILVAYNNPLFRMAITLSEILPVGVIIALISALVLRNRNILPARTNP